MAALLPLGILGCSGARILITLIHEMGRRAKNQPRPFYGLATLCVGVGQGRKHAGGMVGKLIPAKGHSLILRGMGITTSITFLYNTIPVVIPFLVLITHIFTRRFQMPLTGTIVVDENLCKPVNYAS
jgi:hypothetical protein